MNAHHDRETSFAKLRELTRPGRTIYVLLRRKNALGTLCWLEFYLVHENELKRVTWDVAQAINETYCRRLDALKVGRTAVDSGFASVDQLSRALFATPGALRHQWL